MVAAPPDKGVVEVEETPLEGQRRSRGVRSSFELKFGEFEI
jgi:hypothetical protein